MFWGTLLPSSPKSDEAVSARGTPGHTQTDVNISVDMRRRKIYARGAPFVEYRTACGHRIGMCGYTAVPEDRQAYLLFICLDFMAWKRYAVGSNEI